MTTPLSDPDSVQFVVVENYVRPGDEGFTDDEVQRMLAGMPLTAAATPAIETFHLPGKHDQDKHGHDGGTPRSSSGKKIKITHMLVHKNHGKPGDVLAVNGDGTKRVQWDGKKYLLQSKKDGGWTTESTAIKSKAYVEINKFDSDWREPETNSDDAAKPATPELEPKPEPSTLRPTPGLSKPKPAASGGETAAMRAMRSAYEEGYTVEQTFTEGKSGAIVELLRLADNSQVVRKSGFSKLKPEMNTLRQEYLATRVYGASDDSEMTTVQLDDDALLTTFAPGEPGARLENREAGKAAQAARHASKAKQKSARFNAAMAEQKRQAELTNSKQIAILDWVTNKTDRHNLNLTVDGDKVHPVDQGHTFKYVGNNGEEIFPVSPFVNQWIGLSNYFSAKLKPKLTKAEVAKQRVAVEALRSEFNREGESAWFDNMMKRFDELEVKAKK